MRAGVPGVGNLIWSPVLNMYVFAVRLPIREGDSIPYVLTAVLRPEAVLEIVKRQVLPEGATAVVLDGRRTVVARTRNQAAWVGKPPSPTLLAMLDAGEKARAPSRRRWKACSVYTVYHRSAESGWSAAIGIPTRDRRCAGHSLVPGARRLDHRVRACSGSARRSSPGAP